MLDDLARGEQLRLDELRTAHDAEVGRLNANVQDAATARDADKQRFEHLLAELRERSAVEVSSLRSQVAAVNDRLAEETQRLRSLHDSEVEDLRRQLAEATRKHLQEVEDLSAAHELSVSLLQRKLDTASQLWDSTRSQLESERDQQVSSLMEQLLALKRRLADAEAELGAKEQAFEIERLETGRRFDAEVRFPSAFPSCWLMLSSLLGFCRFVAERCSIHTR